MFGASKGAAPKPQGRIDSLIGAGTRIVGDLSFGGGLRIDGEVQGAVIGDAEASTLVISEQAVVTGEVRVAHVVVNGTVNGPIHASHSLELQARARVNGDVFYEAIEVHQGAVVEGRLARRADVAAESRPVELKIAGGNG
jgi:cytoskeletal protein CcmA (bactofilin family)